MDRRDWLATAAAGVSTVLLDARPLVKTPSPKNGKLEYFSWKWLGDYRDKYELKCHFTGGYYLKTNLHFLPVKELMELIGKTPNDVECYLKSIRKPGSGWCVYYLQPDGKIGWPFE